MATTVQKGAKINFYKFVGVGSVSTDSTNKETVESVNKTTLALNNLGATVNSLSKVLVDVKKQQLKLLEAEQKNNKKFEPKYTKKEKKTFTSFLSKLKVGKVPSFFESMLGLIGNLFKLFVVGPALEWISKKENQKAVKNVLEVVSNVLKFVKDWAVFGVTNTVEGLYSLLSDESTFAEKFGGFIRATVGIGSLLLGIRWLTNPLKIITDFGAVIKLFYNGLVKGKADLIKRALRFGLNPKTLLAAGVITAGVMTYLSNQDGSAQDEEAAAQGKSRQQEMSEEKSGAGFNISEPFNVFSRGGKVPSLKGFSQGGWINGPQSGYPVSLDGGRSTSFIGHGSEYVARKSNGGAFVVPFNTPATKTQPNLTSKRMGEAKSQGFSLPGFSNGGNTARSGAPSIKLPEFSRGGNLDKQIYLHWSATDYNYKKGPYNAVIQGDGKVYNDRPSDQVGGEHTWRRNSKGVGIAVAAMSGYNWDSFGPKPIQIENMSKEAANVAKKWGWKPSDININRVMNHAEAASNKDGKSPTPNYGPTWWNGTGERSDLHKLKKSDKDGTGGDKLRAKIRKYMGGDDTIVPTAGLNPGDTGPAGSGDAKIASGDYALLQKLVLAEAGGEGHLGMALVARSVMNRAGLIQKGIVGPGMFMAKSGSIKDVIMAQNGGQYTPAKPGGSLFKDRSDADMMRAQKAIETARNQAGLRGYLEAKGVPAEQINYLMGSTGFRNYDAASYDASQDVNEVKFGNHTFNTAGNKNIITPTSEITGQGGTGGGDSFSPYGRDGSNATNYDLGSTGSGAVFTPSSADSIGTRQGRAAAKSYFQPGVGSNITSGKDQFKLQRQTQEVTTARQQTTQMQKDLISAVLTQVAGSNQSNNAAISKANQMIQEILSSSGSKQATPVLTGNNSDDSSTASLLNSFNNPLRGAFK